MNETKFFDLRLKFCDRLLELQEGCFHGSSERLLKARILPDFGRPAMRAVSLKLTAQYVVAVSRLRHMYHVATVRHGSQLAATSR
ncbi:hypothetical protein I8741_26470, partial [Escherichia coli]|nr:hypothetical protein [Escherichia coli]